MTRKSTKKRRQTPEEKAQREAFKALRDELIHLHLFSIDLMYERGILPPVYSGEHLGEDREAIPLWGFNNPDDEPALGMVLLRAVDGIEPGQELREMREELGLTNDWAVSELLEFIFGNQTKAISGIEKVSKLSVFMVLSGDQVQPAPGYDRAVMLEHMGTLKPYAVFPMVPVSGEGDDLTYHWDDMENMRAEIVYADSPELLETVVWDYRLRLALAQECKEVRVEGGDPEEELVAANIPDLVGLYDLLVVGVTRLYGTTSPLRAQQEKLDIIREENGDLVVSIPLEPKTEPVQVLAEGRGDLKGSEDGVLLRIHGDSKNMDIIWPQIRVHRYYCIRVRQGQFQFERGQVRLKGFSDHPLFEWLMSDDLDQLYHLVHMFGLREFLTLCSLVEPVLKGIDYHLDEEDDPAVQDAAE